MKINLKVIKELNPCSDRYNNYIKFYRDKKLTFCQFMGLKNITHQDKLWVAFRLMTKNNIRQAAADIAESTLHIYESKYPNDNRPRMAIEAARNINSTQEELSAAWSAAWSAARSAASAAWSAAWSAESAAESAAWSAAESSQNIMEKKQRTILIKYLKDKK